METGLLTLFSCTERILWHKEALIDSEGLRREDNEQEGE